MNTSITSTPLKLFAFSLVMISCIGTSCTSLQQATVAASDDLYSIPNNKVAQNQASANNYSNNQSQIDNGDQAEYQDYQSYPDDRYLRLKVANRYRWDALDDFGYWNDPRYNYAFYPSYGGWNSWYSGFYGSSWYNPFGVSMGFGWGGYAPYMNSYYSLGWGFNDFGFGYGGFGGFGYAGLGYGYGGFGWNPYYAGNWNPYAVYYGGGYNGGFPGRNMHYQNPAAVRNSAPGLAAYRNANSSRGFNNSYNTVNGNSRYTGNANLNNNFSTLLKRVATDNNNPNYANSWDRPVRYFNNNNNAANQTTSSSVTNNNYNSSTTPVNNNAGGRSGGYNSSGTSTGGGRAPRNR